MFYQAFRLWRASPGEAGFLIVLGALGISVSALFLRRASEFSPLFVNVKEREENVDPIKSALIDLVPLILPFGSGYIGTKATLFVLGCLAVNAMHSNAFSQNLVTLICRCRLFQITTDSGIKMQVLTRRKRITVGDRLPLVNLADGFFMEVPHGNRH
jgi:hypothetical protein